MYSDFFLLLLESGILAKVKLCSEDVTAIEKLMPKNLEQDNKELHDSKEP
jgi:hypothetical protein